MSDKTASVLKAVQAQFREARSLTGRNAAGLVPLHHPRLSNKPSNKTLSFAPPVMPSVAHVSDAILIVGPSSGQNPERSKSYAQGGTFVRPASGHKSGELKLKGKKAASLVSRRGPKLELRMSATQKEILRQRASQLGMTLTAFAKVMLIDESYDPAIRAALLMLNRQLTGIATNINQATARLHRDGDQAGYMAALKGLTRPLLDTLNEVRSTLARSARGTVS